MWFTRIAPAVALLSLAVATNADGASSPAPYSLGPAPKITSSVVANGDSLTYGYAPLLATLRSNIINNGVPGQSPLQIAARVGAVPTMLTSSTGSICDSGGDTITFPLGYEPLTNSAVQTSGIAGTVAGQHGTITLSGSTLTFICDATGAIPLLNAQQFVVDEPYRLAKTQLFWVGHNYGTIASQYDQAMMISLASNIPPSAQYAFLSNTYDTGSTATFPGGIFGSIVKTNNDFALKTFGATHYIDTLTQLIANYNASFPPDVTDHGNGIPPVSARLVDAKAVSTASLTSSATSVAVNITLGVSVVGDVLVILDGSSSEEDVITAQTGATGSQTLTVTRGFGGNTALSHSSGVAIYIVNPIHFGAALNADTPNAGCLAAGSAYHAAFPSAATVCGYDTIAATVSSWLTSNPTPAPAAPVQSAATDGLVQLTAGVRPIDPTRGPIGTTKYPVQINASKLDIPGTISCAALQCTIPQLYTAAFSVGVESSANATPWFSCYVFAGADDCTPINGANVQLGTASNSFWFADLANLSFFSSVISPDSAGFGSLGSLSKPFGPTYSGSFISKGSHFTVSGSLAVFVTGGPAGGRFTAGTTGTNTVTVTLGGTFGPTAAPTGWACHIQDLTTPADTAGWSQSGLGTTTSVIEIGPAVSGDTMQIDCSMGY